MGGRGARGFCFVNSPSTGLSMDHASSSKTVIHLTLVFIVLLEHNKLNAFMKNSYQSTHHMENTNK